MMTKFRTDEDSEMRKIERRLWILPLFFLMMGRGLSQCPNFTTFLDSLELWPTGSTVLDLIPLTGDLPGWWQMDNGSPVPLPKPPQSLDLGRIHTDGDLTLVLRHCIELAITAPSEWSLLSSTQVDAFTLESTYFFEPASPGLKSFAFQLDLAQEDQLPLQALMDLVVTPPGTYMLGVSLSRGVSGTPVETMYIPMGDNYSYSYSLDACNANLEVYLDGAPVAADGNGVMNDDHFLEINADPIDDTLLFDQTSSPMRKYSPAVADMDDDGLPDVLGFFNDGMGGFDPLPPGILGLSSLFFPGRFPRDNRLADFNGDGELDLIANTYSEYGNLDSVARFYFGTGDGFFAEDPSFAAMGLTGFGETILAADFDNDNDLDIYLPYYTHGSVPGFPVAGDQCYLLINDGSANFTDIAVAAGVDLPNRPINLRPEGAQALDFNGDGYIDIYVAGHFYINNGDLTFTDQRAALGLPDVFDEGIKFLDWNNDGLMDLIIHHPTTGPALYSFDGLQFQFENAFPSLTYSQSFGINIYDLNNDGWEDLVVAGGATFCDPRIFLNNGSSFQTTATFDFCQLCGDLTAFGDLDNNGQIDFIHRVSLFQMSFLINQTETANTSFSVEVLGPNGEKNQQGRMVQASPLSLPGTLFTRVVDGGSGYMAQNQYPILFGTPHHETHEVTVYYQAGTVAFDIQPGESAQVYPSGAVIFESLK